MYLKATMQEINAREKREKETIHSGQFMVSHFEAEEQDDEDDVAVPVPETEVKNSLENIPDQFNIALSRCNQENGKTNQQLSIETNLSKLFQCMSLAYRQKLTSPKWNRFRGIRLRWKDKIRLNNVIWRCWHMQFIMKQNTLICQFASPLDVDTHNKPEAIVLEGKYWKRKLQAVTAEYKKWRMYYRNQSLGCAAKDSIGSLLDREAANWNSQSNDGLHMMVDEDYMDFMSDTLFSTITNQPFVFPDTREIAKAGYADFIQPSLGPLQPNLDDFMDTFEPLNVPEEQSTENIYKPIGWDYPDLDVMAVNSNNMQVMSSAPQIADQYQSISPAKISPTDYTDEMILGLPEVTYNLPAQQTNLAYQSSVISKPNAKQKATNQQRAKMKSSQAQNTMYKESINYSNFPIADMNKNAVSNIVDTLQDTQRNLNSSEGYKFTLPTQQNLKFTRQSMSGEFVLPTRQQQVQIISTGTTRDSRLKKDMEPGMVKQETGAVSRNKTVNQRRQRSRSTSRDQTQPSQRPPLLTAVSDPAILNTNSSVLLTQLLTSTNHLRPIDKTQVNNSVLVKREEPSTNHPVAILPAPTKPVTTLIITTPSQPASTTGQILLSSVTQALGSPVLDHSSRSQDSPESPLGGRGILDSPSSKDDSTPPHREQRRVGHIHAEQKRRYNIKNGFDMIHSLIPHLNQNPNTKLSKAAMLQKGADYIRQLRSERNQLKEEMDSLRQQIECLNTSISNCQSMLPATGAPVSRRRDNKMQEMFDEYVRSRTLENWKFWIFSLMIKPLLNSYNNFVSTSSLEDLYRSTLHWVEQHCTLVDLRPVVLNSLRYLCTKTDILAEPGRLPDEARQAVMNPKPVYP